MATSSDSDVNSNEVTRRSRLTLDLDPQLHLRIKIAAARAGLSMREYLERMLRENVPVLPVGMARSGTGAAPDILERLARTRQALSGGRMVSDSTEIIRQMRDEQANLDERL